MCFDNKVSTHITANKSRSALHHILEHLYHVDTEFNNADHEKLSLWTWQKLNQRSLIFCTPISLILNPYKEKQKNTFTPFKKTLVDCNYI